MTFPHVEELGISETLGTTTIANIFIDDDDKDNKNIDINLKFPTYQTFKNNLNYKFKKRIVESKWTSDDDTNGNIAKLNNISTSSMLNTQINLNSKSSRSISNPIEFWNPNIGKLLKFFIFKNSKFIIFITGNNNDVINIDEIIEVNNTVKFRKLSRISLNSKVFQISTYGNNNNILILIRTLNTVNVLKFRKINKTKYVVTKIFKFEKGQKWTEFADSCMYVSKEVIKLVIIDNIGKFALFSSNNSKSLEFTQNILGYQSIYDPVELSNFKKLLFINENRLLLITRSQIHEYKLDIGKLVCLVCAGTWTKILDLSLNVENNLAYMLTTKEVILIDINRNSFKRRFAWKHFLNDLDMSLYINFLNDCNDFGDDNINHCIISSRQINFNYVIRFDVVNYRVLNQPYLLFLGDFMSLSLDFIKNGTRYWVINNDTDGICFGLLEFDGNDDANVASKKANNRILGSSNISDNEKHRSDKLYKSLLNFYKFEGVQTPTAEQITASIYDKLDSFIENDGQSQISLFQLLENICIPRNIRNISKIVEHLIKNDVGNEFTFKLNKNILNIFSKRYELDLNLSNENLTEQSFSIYNFFKTSTNIDFQSDLTFYLFINSIEIWKTKESLQTNLVELEIEDDLEDLQSDYRKMIDSFETDFKAVGIYDEDADNSNNSEFSHNDPFMASMANMPTISISQAPMATSTQSSGRNKNKLKKKSSQSQSQSKSQYSQGSQLSQSEYSQSDYTQFEYSQSEPESQSQYSQSIVQSQSQPLSQYSLNQNIGFSQSQSKGPKRKKRHTGF